MCRIAGIYDPTSVNLSHDITVMRDCMKHGGPDGAGMYIDDHFPLALGHRRLSLLDLSEAGHQPMSEPDGMIQIVFNGEIYNFLDLKNELKVHGHIFKTTCDTEVILKAYLQWSTGCFKKFSGMFAIAIFDKRTSQVTLARDHAGMKPLYYSLVGGKLIFASEIRVFLANNKGWPESDTWKIHFLTFGHLPEPFTTLQNVVPVKKGTFVIISLPALTKREETFVSFTFQSAIATLPEAINAVREKLTKAVERHLIADAPIGLFLSGGLDSSLLTLLAHKTLQHNLHTISIVFEDQAFSEAKYQKLIIDKTGAKHSSCLVKEEEFYECLPDILNAMDQPSIDGINSYFICKYAHKFGLKAVLSGVGADELFGGYDSFYRTNRSSFVEKLPSFVLGLSENFSEYKKKKIAFLQRKDFLGNYLLNRGLYTPQQTASILNCTVNHVNEVISRVDTQPVKLIKDKRDIVSWGEQNIYMQGQLLKDVDCMGMWHSLEVRLPFLDKELMETAHSIAPEIKYNAATKKHLLIKAFEHLLPKEIYERKKQGFIFPFKSWIKNIQTTHQRDTGFIKRLQQLQSGQIQWVHYWSFLLACHKNTIRFYSKSVKKVLFLNLDAFLYTGGIEKFNRAFLKALGDLEKEGILIADGYSAYDHTSDPRYFSPSHYKGFKAARISFVLEAIKAANKFDTIIIGHINLSLAGWGIKKMYPAKEIILITHGIEVWDKLKGIKGKMMQAADKILAVSSFTKETIIKVHKIHADKISIFHNTIDPFFSYPEVFTKPQYLLDRYRLKANDTIIFTLTRLASSEKYKGYDKVIEILPLLRKTIPGVKYILGGKPDKSESDRIDNLKEKSQVENNLILTGFIKDEEVIDHFLLADVFIMPSQKEGFGIVFIEAMACGLPVIAGNKDGSRDALQNGKLGLLVDPDSESEILGALLHTLKPSERKMDACAKKQLQQKAKNYFGYETYKRNVKEIVA